MADQIQPISGFSGDTSSQSTDGPLGVYRDPNSLLGSPYDPNQDSNALAWQLAFGDASQARYSRYYEGDQFKPYDRGSDYILSLQQLLVRAGFLNPKAMTPREWDPNSAAAYGKALAYANMLGVDVDSILNQLANGADAAGMNSGSAGSLGAAPLTDDDIKAIGNKVAQGVLGRNLNDAEIGNFIPAFRGATGGGTSPATAAENVVRQNVPGEAYAHDVGNAMETISKLLGG